ncbi:MAG TPA: hypothetical protein VLK82_03315 [Candidatus Tectomicrobia bacterium]|nr:hypothetical protein [Candidatus Tectomicrobia bacterium]
MSSEPVPTATSSSEIEGALFYRGYIGGFSGGILTDTGGGIVVNLYTDPQEDVNVGMRHIPAGGPALSAAGDYMQELIKYPPQFQIGFLSNNPPVYDLSPKAREAIERWRLGNRPEARH